MNVTHLGRDAGESYTMRIAHDPVADEDFLFRTYPDGVTTYATRPGRGDTNVQWSPEVTLEDIAAEVA